MSDTQLSRRQIQAIILVFVIVACSLIAFALIALPSTDDPVGSRRFGCGSGMVAALATVWLAKLIVDAIRDRRRGIEHAPARDSGRFHMWFGACVSLGGIVCSAMTCFSAVSAGGGVWTLYYGMIFWGAIHMFKGYRMRRNESDTDYSVIAKIVEDGKPVILNISQGANTDTNRTTFPWLVVIAWKYEGGEMPSKETNKKMIALEDVLEDVLVKGDHCVHALSRTGNGLKEWEYYIRDRESFMVAFNKAFAGRERYPIEITFFHDAKWEELRNVVALLKK